MVHRGCIMIRSRPPYLIFTMILWPKGVSVAPDGAGGWAILGQDGQTVATVGDRVTLGGDWIKQETATSVSTVSVPEPCMTHRSIEAYDLHLGWAIPFTSPEKQLTA
jgi:hypothetical protein